jgi:hypothetical protein
VAIEQMNSSLAELRQAVTSSREAFAAATFADPPDSANLTAKAEILASAELGLADARAEAFAKIQHSDEKLTISQAQKVTEQEAQGFRGGRGGRRSRDLYASA